MSKPETVALLAEAIWRVITSAEWLAAVGRDDERVALLITGICDAIGDGRPVYLPSGFRVRALLQTAERDAAMRRAFDGTNYAALALRYGVSTRQVRRIVDRKSAT